jgi:hypothetical protein
MGRLKGLEPLSAGATIQCVNQLHHNRHELSNSISYIQTAQQNCAPNRRKKQCFPVPEGAYTNGANCF